MHDSRAVNSGTNQDKKVIDLYGIAEDICKQWLSILMLAVAAGLFAFVILSWNHTETYSSSATVALSNANYLSNVEANDNFQYLADTSTKAKSIFQSAELKEAVARELGYSAFQGSVSATQEGTSNLIQIVVKSESPEVSYKEVKAIVNNYQGFAGNVLGGLSVTVLDYPALQSKSPSHSGEMKKAAAAALAVFILILALLAFMSIRKDAVHSGLEIVNKTGVKFLGGVPRIKSGFKTDRNKSEDTSNKNAGKNSQFTDFRFKEGIYKLAIRIAQEMVANGQKVLLITSPDENDEKSAIAASIAIALKSLGIKTARVEANAENIADINNNLQKCREKADLVIVDTAPLSRNSDAIRLSAVADTSILVVRRNQTQTQQIRDAVTELGGSEKVLGCVLSNTVGCSYGVSAMEQSGSGERNTNLINPKDSDEIVFDVPAIVKNMLNEILHYGVVILLVMVLMGGVFYLKAKRDYSPKYSSSATFTVSPLYSVDYKVGNQKNVTNSKIGLMYPDLILSEVMKNFVKEDLGYAKSDTLPAGITASVILNTNVVKVIASSGDPQLAYDVLRSVIRNAPRVSDAAFGSVNLEIIDESGAPTAPSNSPKAAKKAVIGMLLGLIAALVVLAIKLLLRETVLTEDELAWTLNAKCIGKIPWIKSGKGIRADGMSVLINSEDVPREFSQAVLTLSRQVEREAKTDDLRSILVTSAIQKEGKSTVAANLALSLAERGNSVVLVDADLRNPSAMKVLGMGQNSDTANKTPGLVDILTGKTNAGNVLLQYKYMENLAILPGGNSVDDPLLLWNTEDAEQMMYSLRKEFDYVIIDAPQSAIVSDNMLLAGFADACLFIVRRDHAKFDEICEGVDTFSDSKCMFLGCVMR